jgi:hypothetical protein
MSALVPEGFDYGQLDGDDWQFVKDATDTIHQIRGQAVVQIGEQLATLKARLNHGQYGDWLRAEFDWSESSAQSFVQVYEVFGKNPKFGDLGHLIARSGQYLLARESTPEAARDEALARAEAGEQVTHKAAKEIVERHKPGSIFSMSWDQMRDRVMDGSLAPAPEDDDAGLTKRLAKAIDPPTRREPVPPAQPETRAVVADWRDGVDACRQAYLTAACELGRERRIKECERVMRALGLPTTDWTRIHLPQPEAGATWPDDGSLVRQSRDWATFLLDNNHASPNAVQQMGLALMELGQARIGAPVAASQTGESDALATENMDALRERAMRLDAEAVARASGIGLDKIGRSWRARGCPTTTCRS